MRNHPSALMDTTSLARSATAWCAVLLLGLAPLFAATDLYVETAIDSNGQLRIATKRHRDVVPKLEVRQVAFYDAHISVDGRAVGWLALFPDPSTSEPIPFKLVILVLGERHAFTGNSFPFLRWRFWAEGKQVAFEQQTEHGGAAGHYELHDIESGDLIDKYDPDADPESVTKPPRWVVALDARR